MSESLKRIAANVIACELCPRLRDYCRQIAQQKRHMFRHEEYWGRPVPGFGDPQARLWVIGLAPAAHGGNRTGRVFTGDRSGDWLYAALYQYGFANQPISTNREDGLKLIQAYVSAAVRCAPPANKPMREEFDNCRRYLVRELKVLRHLRVIVCLGKLALDSYWLARKQQGLTIPHPRLPFTHGAEWDSPEEVTLLCSYHPSQQNTLTGKLTRPMFHRIFRRARKLCE
ncbi:MAG: uracil-DNA glycosylase [Acidobacteria bacterium]|nr:uracil-DNA glycosylase [Acidobacteriota bacterium]